MKYYVLIGNPTPLARCRVGNRRVWDSQKEIKLIHSMELIKQHNNAPLLTGPLHLDVEFIFPIPKKIPEKKRIQMEGAYYPYKPDLDNCAKFLGDICSGIIYADDNAIAIITAKKTYGEVAKPF